MAIMLSRKQFLKNCGIADKPFVCDSCKRKIGVQSFKISHIVFNVEKLFCSSHCWERFKKQEFGK